MDIDDIDFFVFDFETANSSYSSICQIGIATFKNSKVHETFCVLVNPEETFDRMNIHIHGITEDTIENAPTFSKVIKPFVPLFNKHIAISHGSFDKIAMRDACDKYTIINPINIWADSMRIVRRAWPEKFSRRGYGLDNLCKHFDIELNHHDAGEDSRATALIVQNAIKHTGINIDDWISKSMSKPTPNKISAITNVKGNLIGEVITFTGALTFNRREATEMAAEMGMTYSNGVTKKSTILVVGEQDLIKLDGHKISSKHRKAKACIAKGQPIRIIGEFEFLKIVKTMG